LAFDHAHSANEAEQSAKDEIRHPYRSVVIKGPLNEIDKGSRTANEQQDQSHDTKNGTEQSKYQTTSYVDNGLRRSIAYLVDGVDDLVGDFGGPIWIGQRIASHEGQATE
jgi:hypothetical protein